MTLKLKKPAKGKTQAEAQAEASIGKADIKRSALEAWRKLDAVIQTELTAIQEGKKELNASVATAIIKYVEASVSLASSADDLSAKDTADRQKEFAKVYAKLPTFDDEDSGYNNNQQREQEL